MRSRKLSRGLQVQIDRAWDALESGADIVLPVELTPELKSWKRPDFAEPQGQLDDRVLSVRSSRLHARQWPSGIWTLHRDRWDPSRSPVHGALHLTTETIVGRLLFGAVISVSVGIIFRRLIAPKPSE